MNIAVILAGGIGKRLGAEKPKQFVELCGKPMILYSMEIYQKSSQIDAIEIVCVKEYINFVWKLVSENNISKVRWICEGGATCQESTRNGIFNLEGQIKDDDMLSFNMSSSLFVSEDILSDSFRIAKEYGAAFACMPCVYNNAETQNGISSNTINYKENNRTINMPWTSSFGKLKAMYHKAYDENIETGESSYMPTLFVALGEPLFFSKDDGLNKIHIQKTSDMQIAEAIIEYRKNRGML